jgi:hypothetical protein
LCEVFVLGRLLELHPAEQERRVAHEHARMPDLPPRAREEAVRAIGAPVGVRADDERQREALAKARDPLDGSERRHDHREPRGRALERLEAVAHLDEVRLARQSGEVSEEDQEERPPAKVGEPRSRAARERVVEVGRALACSRTHAPKVRETRSRVKEIPRFDARHFSGIPRVFT